MIVRNSLKQLAKTPVKTILFLLLFTVSVLLVSLGGSLWYSSMQNIHRFEGIFTTIATVEQIPTASTKEAIWDWESKSYHYVTNSEYGPLHTLKDLELDGIEYLCEPEIRPYYSAYSPYVREMEQKTGGYGNSMIMEVSPQEDCIPAGPVRMNIKNVLFSYYKVNEPYFYLCDHSNKTPDKLYADKTYVMSIVDGFPHNFDTTAPEDWVFEYWPGEGVATEQADKDGSPLKSEFEPVSYQEVTENFYETDAGKRWLALSEARKLATESVPVTATNNTNLMLPFYNGDAFILEGNGLSEEDYKLGNKVCLVSRKFAKLNSLQVGDEIHLPMRSANYSTSANIGINNEFWAGIGLLNARGEVYNVFEDSNYTICGIYDTMPGSALADAYRLNDNEIIVPKASIKNSDENNIIKGARMKGYTTSFQIPNGDIDKFTEVFSHTGIDDLEITFYDKGYTKLESGLQNMKRMSIGMLVAGSITSLFVLLFFCNMLITKQRKRTAVERSLGMSKRQCTWSLLSGILLIALVGSLLGSIGGMLLSRQTSSNMTSIERYDRNYSVGKPASLGDEDEAKLDMTTSGDLGIAIAAGVAMFMVAGLIATYDIRKNLQCEPLELLSSSE